MNGLYRVREFAELAGVTVRALHHYDRVGLLHPRRTASGYRVYGLPDLERLEQIVALKFLGLPLKQIQEVLDRDDRSLSDVLRSQRCALQEKKKLLDTAIRAIQDAEAVIQPGRPADAAVLRKIIEVIEMQDQTDFMNRYYSPEAQAKMAERRAKWDPSQQPAVTQAWTELFCDIEAALGQDPASPQAQALAARWKALIEAFTGADPDITQGLAKAWRDRPNWSPTLKEQTAPFTNPAVWEFIRKASACK